MNKDHVKGAVNEALGRAKRQAGEWTGDKDAQVEGAVQQLKGKGQKAWGDVKDAARDVSKEVEESERESSEERAHRTDEEQVQTHHGH